MRARSFVVVVLVALVTAGIGATGQGAAAVSADEQTYIVTVDEQHDPAVVSERLEQAGKGQTQAVYRAALNGFATELSASDVGTVRAAPGVESVRPSRRFAAAAPAPCTDVRACQTTTRGLRRMQGDLSSAAGGRREGLRRYQRRGHRLGCRREPCRLARRRRRELL